MSVEADIKTLLSPLAPTWPAPAGELASLPRITYQQVGGRAVNFLGRDLPTLKNGRFQITAWAKTDKEVSTLILAIEAALILTTSLQVEVLGAPIAVYEEDTKLYGRHQDFSIWSPR
jgi:hypothetical protein